MTSENYIVNKNGGGGEKVLFSRVKFSRDTAVAFIFLFKGENEFL